MTTVAILGAGAWGSALATTIGKAGHKVILWSRTNGAQLSDAVAADIVLLATPAQTTREMLGHLGVLPITTPLVLCGKGLEQSTGLRLDEVVHEWRLGQTTAYLSGPNFAAEVAAGMPTAGVIAAADMHLAQQLCSTLSTPTFRLYANDDVTGVGLLGALKNPLAIGAGLIAGAGKAHNLGENARAAFITRGLAEVTRLGLKLGAKPATFAGLAGVGDIILTCSSTQSRNYRYGFAIGSSTAPDANTTVEGLPTIGAAHALAKTSSVELPLIEALHALLYDKQPLGTVLDQLLNRPLKQEA